MAASSTPASTVLVTTRALLNCRHSSRFQTFGSYVSPSIRGRRTREDPVDSDEGSSFEPHCLFLREELLKEVLGVAHRLGDSGAYS